MSPQIYRVLGKGVLMYIYVINKVYRVLLSKRERGPEHYSNYLATRGNLGTRKYSLITPGPTRGRDSAVYWSQRTQDSQG